MANETTFKFLSKAGLRDLVGGLLAEMNVFGTIDREGFPAWGKISKYDELKLYKNPTPLSAKEFLFPQKETLVKFNMATGAHVQVIDAPLQALIGLHPCDIHAMVLMDRVFAAGRPDANYLARRENTIIIGTDCFPDDYCFCKSVGTMNATTGFDLFINEIRSGYLVKTGSERGAAILKKHTTTRKATNGEVKILETERIKKESGFKASLDAKPEELPAIYAKSDDSPVWDRIGAICYGCGSCNNVCPTCYCFDVLDEVTATLDKGERVRVWDGCTLEDFTKVAGGHNFRKTRASRLRHRFNRKFRYLSDKFDSLFCVGCGRCSRTCLVKINITEVTNELIRERRK